MKISMLTIGSTGDVRPYVLLGRELKARGHEITIATLSGFEKLIEENGLNYFPLSGDVVKLMSNVMKPGVNGVTFLKQFEDSIKDVAPVLLADLTRACEGADAMMCTFLGSLFYSIAEKHNIPCIQTHYFPMDPNAVTPISSAPGQRLGKTWNRTSYRLGYLLISMLEKRYLTQWRVENGLEVRKLKTTPDYRVGDRTVPVIYAVSPMVLPRPKEWGEHIHMSGFWWDDEPVTWEPPQELQEFLDNGEQPIYIGFGSMVSGDMNKTFTKVLKAVRAARVRAVINLGWAAKDMHLKSNNRVYFADYVPHDWLFPRVRAVVHHGGAGTTAAGLRYGKPTLVVPFGGDQPFWGNRINAIGCGPKPISRDRLTVQRLTKGLIDLTTHGSYRVAAQEMGMRLSQETGTRNAADIVEREIAAWKENQR
ncbi:MAG: glycosyltransferase family 1 protein [Clostridiales bacterium]|nr:glycosyltransferase family 1 protein [Clostridiales bacterium]